jgi:hypothetical protein
VTRIVSIWLAGGVAVLLMVGALWAWRFAPELAMQHADRPYVAKVGIRCLAIALAAAAQVILLTLVVSRLYPPRVFDRLLSIGVAVTSFAALAVAVVLAVSSR